jgi:LuxR family quorum-sensing transcriptional regulator LasR
MKYCERFADLKYCDSVIDWRDLVLKLGSDLGFEQILLAILPDRNTPKEAEFAFLHSNYSTGWRNKYDADKLQQVDPVFAHCVSKSTPLVWSPEIFSSAKQKEMYEEACAHGLRSGITLPIHGAQGEMGTLCFVADSKPGKGFQREAHHKLPTLSYLRDFIFETSLQYIKPAQTAENLPVTPCELECLKWHAAGKSSWEIAKILHRSEATVNFHFSSLRRKFSVSSRQQVMVRAMRQGLIQP